MRFSIGLTMMFLGGALTAGGAQAQVEGPQPTQVLVRVEKAPGVIQKNDLQVKVNGHNTPVSRVTPVVGRSVAPEIAIVLDDGSRGAFGNNLADLGRFVQALPPNVATAVGYMRNGDVYFAKPFTTDHREAAEAIRIPFGQPGISASPYLCLSELAKHWPTNTGAPRVVLMITNGIDPYNGSVSPMNQNSPYVETAIRDAQRNNVVVYSIFWSNRGIASNFGGFSGTNYLTDLAQGTGGELLSGGMTINGPSVDVYLQRFQKALAETYLLQFDAPFSRKNKTAELKVNTSLSGAKVHAPKEVGPTPVPVVRE
jgi:hypothetical protein